MCGIENVNAKEIWLNYFNNTLYEKNVITKSERDKMACLIRNKCRTQYSSGKVHAKHANIIK